MQAQTIPDRRKAILLLIFGCLGALAFLGRGIYLVVSNIPSFTLAGLATDQNVANDLLDASGMLFCLLLMLPLIYYNAGRLKGREYHPGIIPPAKAWQVVLVAVVWIFIVLVVTVLGQVDYGWVALIPVFPLGLALPAGLLAWVAAGGLPTGSARRLWSIFGVGLIGSTGAALVVEYLMIGVATGLFGLFTLGNPAWRAVLEHLKNQLTNTSDMQSLINVISPYLSNPLVFVLLLAGVAVAGPMIEEAAKPLGLWLLGDRLGSPAEGFALGALCGAGFALLEGLMAASGAGQMWGVGMAARLTSSLMHIAASSIAGWGIASFRLKHDTRRLAGAYVTAVGIHGLWNGSTLLVAFSSLRMAAQAGQPGVFNVLAILMGAGMLVILFPVILVALPLLNRRLRPPKGPVAPPQPPSSSERQG